MDREETLVELVERMERATNRLERIVYGDADIGAIGLNERVSRLERILDEIMQTRTSPLLWAIGFGLFVAGFALLLDQVQQVLSIQHPAAAWVSALLLALSFIFFWAGFGWLRRWFQ